MNSVILDKTGQSNRIFHSDEAGRPKVKEVDVSVAFTPDGQRFLVKDAESLGAMIKTWSGKGYAPFINKGWYPLLDEETRKLAYWADSVEDVKPPKGGESKPPVTAEAVSERKKELDLRQEALKVTAQEQHLKAQEAYLEAQEKDERLRILNSVRVSLPDLTTKIGTDLQETKLRDRQFTPEEKALLFAPGSGKVTHFQDFFELSKVERDDLLDRIGFYRGLVIDHNETEIIQQSFRDALQRHETKETADGEVPQTKPAQLFYRKPKQSGYFDSDYTFSEVVHQLQKNGVTNLKFSLAAAGGKGVKWGVGAGYGYSTQSETKEDSVNKKVYITTNYYLPMVDLSFNHLESCASTEFIQAVQEALAKDGGGEASYRQLLVALRMFGHFVPTRIALGGKLYATQEKTLSSQESASDVTTRHAAEAKVAVDSMLVTADAQASAETGKREQSKASSVAEAQRLAFTAVGGDGSALRNPGNWSDSLEKYKAWSVISSDNLIPSLAVLPVSLREDCIRTLRNHAEQTTVRDLLKETAFFLFYGDYSQWAGDYARKVYFQIINAADQQVLTLNAEAPADGSQVLALPNENSARQAWYMTPDGYLISLVKNNDKEFVLTIREEGKLDKTVERQLVVTEKGRYSNQAWEFTGSGHLVNLNLGLDQILTTQLKNQVTLAKPAGVPMNEQRWAFKELSSLSFARSVTPGVSEPVVVEPQYFAWGYGPYVLSVRESEYETPASGTPVVLMPYWGHDHQLWRITEEGLLVCKGRGVGKTELCLAQEASGSIVVVEHQPANSAIQTWREREDGALVLRLNERVLSPGNPQNLTQGSLLTIGEAEERQFVLRKKPHTYLGAVRLSSKTSAQVFESKMANGADPDDYVTTNTDFTFMDTRPINVYGPLRGAALWINNPKIGRKTLMLKLLVARADGKTAWVKYDSPDDDRLAKINEYSVDAQVSYPIPGMPIEQAGLMVKGTQPRYGLGVCGKDQQKLEVAQSQDDERAFNPYEWAMYTTEVIADDQEEVIGLGFMRDVRDGKDYWGLRLVTRRK